MPDFAIYVTLFAAAFGAATVLPLQSEAMLVGLLQADYPPLLLVAVASTGNILGSIVNWIIGRQIDRFKHRRWFPATDAGLERARRWYRRYGRWTLLLSWVPVIGDPLTIVAGVMREPFSTVILFVTIAKTGRYLILMAVVLQAS